jgi:hypothetical protein
MASPAPRLPLLLLLLLLSLLLPLGRGCAVPQVAAPQLAAAAALKADIVMQQS